MSNTETSIVVCKKCGVKKTRYFAGRYGNKKDTRWVDENGIQWSGSTCSTCHKENVAERKRNKRMADGLLEGLNQALVMEKNKP